MYNLDWDTMYKNNRLRANDLQYKYVDASLHIIMCNKR